MKPTTSTTARSHLIIYFSNICILTIQDFSLAAASQPVARPPPNPRTPAAWPLPNCRWAVPREFPGRRPVHARDPVSRLGSKKRPAAHHVPETTSEAPS